MIKVYANAWWGCVATPDTSLQRFVLTLTLDSLEKINALTKEVLGLTLKLRNLIAYTRY